MNATDPTQPGRVAAPWGFAAGQAAIGIWLAIAARVFSGTSPNASGVLDDLTLVVAFTGAQVLLCGLVRSHAWGARLAAGMPLLLVLSLFTFANALFFDFFETPLSIAALRLAGLAADATSSLPKLLRMTHVVALLVLPAAAQVFLLSRATGRESPLRSAAILAVAVALGIGASITRQPVYLFVEQNPAMSLLRDAFARGVRGALGAGPAERNQDLPFLLNRSGYDGYRFAGTEETPLLQRADPPRSPADPKNVVLILMESMRGLEMQRAFRELPVTPELNALEQRAVTFPNFYANGMTTVDAEFSILCSALPVVNEPPVYIRKPALPIRCLPEILEEIGYSTHWISAYKSSYGNKRRFLRGHGVQHVHDRKTMEPERAAHPQVGWGMGDVDMFAQALEKLGGFREPFFAEIMTLSNHHPFDHDYDLAFPESLANVRGDQHYRDYLRGMYYTDHAVGTFLAAAREQPWFARTVFVILGDHAVRAFPDAPGSRGPDGSAGGALGPVLEAEVYFRNRLVLYAPEWLEPAQHETLGSQIDVAPTLLDLLGVRSDNSFLGVSLLADVPRERRFALMNIGHVFNMRVDDQYCYSVGYSCFEGVFPRCARGVEPTSLGHTCFRSEADLLAHPDLPGQAGETSSVAELDALERLGVLDRAERIMRLNRRLIDESRFRESP